MRKPDRRNAIDHVVVVMFENRSFDNLLGCLYEPGEVESFEGVLGKELSNPIPEWAEHGADRRFVPYGVANNMDTPNPDPGEEFQHINTQLFGRIDPPGNRGAPPGDMVAPFNAPDDPHRTPTMDGFVADYISAFTAEMSEAAHVRRVRPDHDRLHARADAGDLDTRAWLRHVRPLVL